MILEVKEIVLAYGLNRVVRDVSFSAERGEAFALLGPNGAGKTSILRAISGLLKPVSGEIRYEGRSIVGHSPGSIARAGIAHVPEGRHVFPEMSVYDNLMVGATPHIRQRKKVRELLERNYELFPILKERRNQAAGTFSGGEQQQLVVARGLMADPKVLLVDEPTLGLAPVVIETLVRVFRQVRELGLTIVVAEQNADFALKVADNGAVMASGEVHFSGDAEKLRTTEDIQRAYLGA